MEPEVKRHIDNARQVLVGVVPNPISQIDQITYALIYKFMDDMDQSAIAEGGEPSFFIRDLESYSWTKLMDSKIGNQNRMNLYVEAFQKFSEAEQLPELFRNILRQAFLPYRSPDVLWLFLKEIDYFDYSHPEELGNAYEYLLSIMGSQGDAGQFRTPRHIIDFIVDVIQPTENDKILDPACGTGGFLVKAYQHILEQHQGEKKLNPTQKLKIMENFEGYDIDPGMARIAQVNMFLHQFKSPKIVQYDTLSMEERWNDKFDVIMANPPFMSPKGGIKPHSKFSVQSTRSEVLFVDYIMNHLKPKGRAGIIVPEGIIFQSGNAYKQLRKNLVNDGLYAVVSLPSGVFQPYSGVKTSILMFNNEIAKQRDEILFIKIENDGFDLGANKRPITKNDLPEALEILSKWRIKEKTNTQKALWVTKSKLSESGDYNLSGDRYRTTTDYSNAKWPMVEIGDLFSDLKIGGTPSRAKEEYFHGNNLWVSIKDMENQSVILDTKEKLTNEAIKNSNCKVIKKGSLLMSFKLTVGRTAFAGYDLYTNEAIVAFEKCHSNEHIINLRYLSYVLPIASEQDSSKNNMGAPMLNKEKIKALKIPLPPLEIQQQIVEELDSYQNIINGAKQIIANWKPRIDIDPFWPKVKLGDFCEIKSGGTPSKSEKEYWNGDISWYSSGELNELYTLDSKEKITSLGLNNSNASIFPKGSLLIGMYDTAAFKMSILNQDAAFNQAICGVKPCKDVDLIFLYLFFIMKKEEYLAQRVGVRQRNLNKGFIENLVISLPPLEIQQEIVDRIESERSLVESAKKLIENSMQKISNTLTKIWINKD